MIADLDTILIALYIELTDRIILSRDSHHVVRYLGSGMFLAR